MVQAPTTPDIGDILERISALEKAIGGSRNGPLSDHNEIQNCRLPAAAVAARYGVVTRTIDRWLEDPKLGFPRPTTVNRRRYWWLGQLSAWDFANGSRTRPLLPGEARSPNPMPPHRKSEPQHG
jgi:hypothetical protein